MKYRNTYRVESTRIPEYNYSQPGGYFITVCTKEREYYFGEIFNANMRLSKAGEIVKQCLLDLPFHYPNVQIDEFVIMPNHIHAILIITDVETGLRPVSKTTINPAKIISDCNIKSLETGLRPVSTKTHGIPEFVRALKSFSTRKINIARNSRTPEIWQSRYYEHVIRSEKEMKRIRESIFFNPINWDNDEDNIHKN